GRAHGGRLQHGAPAGDGRGWQARRAGANRADRVCAVRRESEVGYTRPIGAEGEAMTGLPEIVVKLRGVAARTVDYLADKKLRDAADEVEAAVADFNPTLDLPGGVRRIGAALAHANRVYEQVQNVRLLDPVG